ncbi:RNB domain-containing ribonuclease [Nocardioides sp. S-58]|uniref:RNB domain-containing ribonuclease n=1 Tax=Nocardioides renjunii TaxID=3095075 RepID=A0ABU5KAN0_9ACTN|nr:MULTISPECIES: RNB domain-containing ribonuclease [unclassified Nocardioides]MDZ5661640.1 RNB domain-containing ribonuclease [Nocardioides sp. S-58]WQQ23861.1 RNB domain-containing ribonuclease [Nocardioides sp. S-34]
MPSNRVVKVRSTGDSVTAQEMRDGIAAIQQEMKLSAAFPDAVEEAAAAAAAAPRLPELDRTDIELVTIDPEGARDLDQAMHIARDADHPGGYVVHYAIADVAAFVTAGDPVDVEANRRGETLYGADSKIPLHPKVLSEGAASLLPDQVRPALLWTIRVDDVGEGVDVQVERALVRSRAQLSYLEVQADLDAGRAPELIGLLKEVGELRLAREAARGGVSLPLPEQELVETGDGHWELEFRRLTPVENWNAQISLLTGMAAASLMVYARVGILRTLPPADPRDVQRLHRTARALGIEWPAEQLYPDFIRTLDPSRPTHAAMIVACTRLLRGAGYVTFNGELPEQAQHSALASEYAHVTAPLRRLADRYAGEICVALCAGTEVPDWVISAMAELPDTMTSSGRRANQYENAVVNLCEAELLSDRVGETFTAVVVDLDEKDKKKGDITIQDPAIEASVVGSADLPLGEEVTVELVQADPRTRTVEFRLV